MASKFGRYERAQPLSAQSKKNISEGMVLKNIIRSGALPFDTTVADAKEFDIDLSRRPRKGKRKKGLLPELTKKEYKEQLDKKIKDFTKEEKRIYNALAKREGRGYIPNRDADKDIADELDDFLMDDIEDAGGGVVATIEDVAPPPTQAPSSIEDLLANLPTPDELPEIGLEELPEFLPPPEEVKIPQGISSKVEVAPVDSDSESDSGSEYSEFDADDIEYYSQFTPRSKRAILGDDYEERLNPTKRQPVFVSGKKPRFVEEDIVEPPPPPPPPPRKRPSRKNPLLLSNKELREYTSDPTLSVAERGRRVNEVNAGFVLLDKSKGKVEREKQLVRQKEQERIDLIEQQERDEASLEDLFTSMEQRSRLEELRYRDAKVEETMRKLREENRLEEELILESQRKRPIKKSEEDFLGDELDDLLPDPLSPATLRDLEKGAPPTPKTPQPLIETFQPPTPDNFYTKGSPLPPTPSADTRLLFQDFNRKPPPTPPTRQRRTTTTPIFARERLQEAGVGELSLGGATQRYRLLDFEARPPNTSNQPVFQQLLKNNKQRRK